MKHFFCREFRNLYFSFFHVLNQSLFEWFDGDYTLYLYKNFVRNESLYLFKHPPYEDTPENEFQEPGIPGGIRLGY
jgi:hypothetical protein